MNSSDDFDAFEAAAAPSLSARAVAARPTPYLDDLNPAQREAVETLDGPVLMLAGAGTGKTRALTARIVHLLNTGRARPNEILAVTFTNKAAREMKNRVHAMLGETVEGMPWLGTFHAICVKLLRRHAELISIPHPSSRQAPTGTSGRDTLIDPNETGPYDHGSVPLPPDHEKAVADRLHLKTNFTILDTDDQIRLLKQLIIAAGIDDKRWPARALAHVIDGWKNRAWTPDKVTVAESSAFNDMGLELYAAYQERLITLNAVDFGDLLMHVVTIFQTHPDVLAQYQRWFKYILVDEYQDTNVAQYLWLRLLAQGHKNICCVGDDDQSIYGWRGAEVGNILRFEKDFPGAKVVRLEQNYRSTPHILAAASGVISGNEDRLGKGLWTEEKEGNKVRLIGNWDGEEEARWVGEKIEALHDGSAPEAKNRNNPRSANFSQELDRRAKHGLGRLTRQEFVLWAFESGSAYKDWKVQKLVKHLLKDDPGSENMYKSVLASPVNSYNLDQMAILVRASHQMRAFEDRFLTIGLPYRVIGGPRFYERLEIRDAMAYFRVAISPDDDLAFERIVNTPKRGVGGKGLQTLQINARQNGVSLLEGTRIALSGGDVKGKARGELAKLLASFDFWNYLIRKKGDEKEIAGHNSERIEHESKLSEFQEEEVKLVAEYESLEQSAGLESPSNDDGVDPIQQCLKKIENCKFQIAQCISRIDYYVGIVAILNGDHILLAEKILDDSGYTEMWQNDKTPEAPGRLENLKELVKALEGFDNLQGFLEHIALIMDNESDEAEEKVSIMTLHGSKGLEYPAIFLPGWEDGLFPSQRSMDESGLKGLEEERRLAYVGITRAEEICTISFAANRMVYGQWQSALPSRFIDELPSEHVEVLTPPGLYGGAYGAAAPEFGSDMDDRVARADGYNSPGWKRLQARAQQRGLGQPSEGKNTVINLNAVSSFTQGDRIFHQKFGYGAVMGIEGDKLDIEFEKAGAKKVVAKFVTAAERKGDVPF